MLTSCNFGPEYRNTSDEAITEIISDIGLSEVYFIQKNINLVSLYRFFNIDSGLDGEEVTLVFGSLDNTDVFVIISRIMSEEIITVDSPYPPINEIGNWLSTYNSENEPNENFEIENLRMVYFYKLQGLLDTSQDSYDHEYSDIDMFETIFFLYLQDASNSNKIMLVRDDDNYYYIKISRDGFDIIETLNP